MAHKVKKEGIFFSLLLLTGFFFLLEISFFIQGNQVYFSDFIYVSSQLRIPLAIIPGIVHFIFVQLLIHFIYCLVIWLMTLSISFLFMFSLNKKLALAILLWAIGIAFILMANQIFYPNSRFSSLTSIFLPNLNIANGLFILLVLIEMVFAFLALLGLVKYFSFKGYKSYFVLSGLILIVCLLFALKPQEKNFYSVATQKRPNIILIGLDSLRPDFLSFFCRSELSSPFIDSFLNEASVFNEAVTPLARTFPSWVSILTGEYPLQSGIRSNLAPQDHADFTNTLPAILQREGYETVYATDETRFSNIDNRIGFNQVISPPMGLNDFLLGTFNDFPFSNLLTNTLIGRWLFPYSYANRAADFSYKPNSFLNLLHPLLQENQTKPLFLSIHFCLMHYPYVWAESPAGDFSIRERYAKSMSILDMQVRDFFSLLKESHLLDHAIVVLLSDHGEALEFPGDRITEKELFLQNQKNKAIPLFYPPSLDEEAVNQSAGHGTDVLGLSQYHSLLAFKLYGLGHQQKKTISGVVSLLDIKPTLLHLLHLPSPKSSGISLASIIQGKKQLVQMRHIFIESDFTPKAIQTMYPATRDVMLQGVRVFQIDPLTTRLSIKKSMEQMILHTKQYADIYGEWMLALYPQDKKSYMPILINLVSGRWTNDLQSSFAQKSPLLSMLDALKIFYSNDLNNKSLSYDSKGNTKLSLNITKLR